MRGIVVGTCVVVATAAYACDSFEEPAVQPGADAGDDAIVAEPDAQGVTDAAIDQTPACEGEPDWVSSASAEKTRICDGATVDLVTSSAHCGRCNHSCGADACADGMCAQTNLDVDPVFLDGVRDGVLYYTRRPGGTFSGKGHEIKRLVPGNAPAVLASLEVDGGIEKEIVAASPGAEHVYLRTKTALRRASIATPTTGLPELVATLSGSDGTASIAVAGDRVYVTTPSLNKIEQVFFDGGIAPFIDGPTFLGETSLVGGRYFYGSQPFLYFFGNTSALRMREGTVDELVYGSPDKVGGMTAIDGNEMYVMRAAPQGAIVRVDLITRSTQPFYEGDLDNAPHAVSVTLDATHVYWLKGTAGSAATTEIWKRARCGGAAVRIGKHPNATKLLVLGDRLYVGADDGLFSLAK